MLRPAAVLFALAAVAARADDWPRTPSPEGATAYIVQPADGETVSSPVTVVFGARGIGIAPAGVEWDATGHHHLLINREITEAMMTESLPAEDDLRHFGGGQTEVTLELPPGEHRLQLLMGDHNHIPHDPPVYSAPVTIVVE